MPTDTFDLEIRAYDPERYARAGFDCGVARLNNYLALTAKKHQAADLTRVYVALRAGDPRILGYHAINAGSMNVEAMAVRPRSMPAHGEVPVLFLGQIAVDLRAQGTAIGGILIHHVFLKAQTVAEQVGCHAILLDVISDGDEGAFEMRRRWYEGYGFQAMPGSPGRMFITVKDVRASL